MARYRSGESGNAKGRPPGRLDRRHRLRNLIDSHADELVTLAVQQARAGDVQALSLLLARAVPALRPASDPITFDLAPGASLADQARAVLAAIADGRIDPHTGKALVDAVAAVANVTALDEIERRIAALEQGDLTDET